jgi:DNA helicase-2/ATP-dependent DNA helicase PcrA
MILAKISELKTKLIFPESYEPKDYFSEIVAKIYKAYQQELKNHNALDFDDLIILPVRIFKQNTETLKKYQEFWKYILVDEYQDTSYDQYIFISLLAGKYKNLFCIGDDAQSIYQFRRADIRNILNFQKDYPEAKVILLEQNYRSTKNIITAAQHIISNNKNQIPKELWTANEHGEKIIITETMNERHEANHVISTIQDYLRKNYSEKDFALLYRTHAQSRALEEALIMRGVPYQIVGGLKFYDRKEIKDIIAYLKLIANPSDSVALERIYNIPARGIGKSLLEKVRGARIGNEQEFNIQLALKNILKEKTLPARQLKAVYEFSNILDDISAYAEKNKLSTVIKYIIKKIKYEDYLKEFSASKNKDFENFEDRMENLRELLTVTSKYEDLSGKEGIVRLVEEITLFQNTDKIKNDKSRITLMTIHAAKGLEFPVVFIVGMEEGLFPHSRTILNPNELEEERRLCYVAATRAKDHLFLTYTKFRNIFGSHSINLPSRFIGEIPTDLVEHTVIDNYGYDDEDDEDVIRY